MCKITFWGVRGSIPIPGKQTVRTGGNTSCVEVRCNNKILIFDAGTGIRECGNNLIKEAPIHAYIFFSHVHWDHIQGFPFFIPAFMQGNSFDLYGAAHVTSTLEETLAGQMNYPNFPVTLQSMAAKMNFHNVNNYEYLDLGDGIVVWAVKLNHPGGVNGYRVSYKDKVIVYATDTEHYDKRMDEDLLKLASNADVLIYDSQYFPEEYRGDKGFSKVGWGHSTYEEGTKIAKLAGVKKLILFHHDINHSDEYIDKKEKFAQEIFPDTIAAREGLIIQI